MPYAIQVKSILNKTKRRDPWFLDEYTINPYSGCSFNCLYCYIRGSKYGTNMEEKTAVKSNALEVLEKQLHNRAKKDLSQKYHSFFDNNNEMPKYYREAFYKKMRELSEQYGLRNSIIEERFL
jgi:hypothetical protein